MAQRGEIYWREHLSGPIRKTLLEIIDSPELRFLRGPEPEGGVTPDFRAISVEDRVARSRKRASRAAFFVFELGLHSVGASHKGRFLRTYGFYILPEPRRGVQISRWEGGGSPSLGHGPFSDTEPIMGAPVENWLIHFEPPIPKSSITSRRRGR